MATDVFLDSNVLLYLFSADVKKIGRVQELVDDEPFISVQVLNEFVNVARRKYSASWEAIDDMLVPIKSACRVESVALTTHELAVRIAATARIHIYDANIVAAAQLAGCHTLMTEDLNPGQRFGGVTIRNPFV